jgi:hypothetical protein
MKKVIPLFFFLFIGCSISSYANESEIGNPLLKVNSDFNYSYEYASKVDSGFFSSIQKGYEIASKLTIDDVGKIATIVLFNNNKKMDSIVKDVSEYVNQVGKARQDLRKIKINKNTKIVVKRDK